MNLWIIFVTGLTVGGLTCMAIQGGLLASLIASQKEETLQKGESAVSDFWLILTFLSAKFIAYVILGALLGIFGSVLGLSPTVRIIMQVIVGTYMIAIALNLLNIHPIFRYVMIRPPKFFTKTIRHQSKSKALFAPGLLGALTIFIPCGTTLAMEALAISSGSPIIGASILGVFVLGTTPLFFGLGYITSTLGDTFKKTFFKVAAVLVIYLGLSSLNGALVLAGSPITWDSVVAKSPIQIDLSGGTTSNVVSAKLRDGKQYIEIQVFPTGYLPAAIQVRKDVPLELQLTTTGGYGCTSDFIIPSLGISKSLSVKGTEIIEFTPRSLGNITWTCSMGMYSGVIEVI